MLARMPKTPILTAAFALVLLTACDGGPGPGPEDDGKDEPDASFAHATASELDGTFFYLVPADSGAEVWSFSDGGKPEKLMSGDANMWASANPSPNGGYLSYVDMDSTLRIQDLDANLELKAEKKNVDATCQEPVWSPESGKLLFHNFTTEPPQTAEWMTMPKGETAEAEPAKGCHVRFGAGAGTDEYAVIAGDLSGVVLRDGDEETTIPADAVPDRQIVDLVSVARGNAALCVATVEPQEPVGDAARSLGCDSIIDTETKQPIELPGDITTALFPESGGFVTRNAAGELSLSDKDETGIASVKEPAELAEGSLIGYAEP